VPDVPDHVGKKNQRCDSAADPNPFLRQSCSLRRQHQAKHKPAAENGHRVFVLKPEPGHNAEPQPQPLVAGVDDAQQKIRAAHPEERLEGVHGEQVVQHEEHADGGRG
jgi:hypothetical protein